MTTSLYLWNTGGCSVNSKTSDMFVGDSKQHHKCPLVAFLYLMRSLPFSSRKLQNPLPILETLLGNWAVPNTVLNWSTGRSVWHVMSALKLPLVWALTPVSDEHNFLSVVWILALSVEEPSWPYLETFRLLSSWRIKDGKNVFMSGFTSIGHVFVGKRGQ